MEFLDEQLLHYCEQHSEQEPEALKKLNRFTHARVLQPRMLSGHLQGRFLSMISALVRPKTVLEIGTYTGYSALCFAEGLAEDGKVITIDVNPELEDIIREHIALAGMESKVQFIVGDAYQIIRTLDITIDLVFIDADKQNYGRYYDLVIDKVRPGGIILADNVLWSGKVLDPNATDKDTLAIKAFNQKVSTDTRVKAMLLPLRDGIMMLQKK